MSKYFVKYLPVEGDVKEGDWFIALAIGTPKLRETGAYPKWSEPIKHTGTPTNKLVELMGENRKKKVKLFLCSRDIQVGDKVTVLQFNGDPNWKAIFVSSEEGNHTLKFLDEDRNFGCASDGYFKVIGEISPEATWVKEGDEFEEDEIAGLVALSAYDFDSNKLGYMIKGPCGHFH